MLNRFLWLAAAAAVCSLPAAAQTSTTTTETTQTVTTEQTEQMTGVSHPPQDVAASPDEPAPAAAPLVTVERPAAPTVAPVAAPPPTIAETPAMPPRPVLTDPSGDYGVVGGVAPRPGELEEGEMLHVKLGEVLSTSYTPRGSEFHASLATPLMQNGHVLVPAGSVLMGHVTISEEKRVAQGHARLHLKPDEIVLPNGTRMEVHARVIATDQDSVRVDREGTILSRPQIKKNLIVTGATTGTGAVAGAVVGGPLGAGVGAIAGAGVGGGHWLMQENTATLPENSILVLELTQPLQTVQ